MVVTRTLKIATSGQGDAKNLTVEVARAVERSGVASGLVTVFVVGSTAGVSTIEFEPGAVKDLGTMFERLAPRRGEYAHHLRWGDDNGSSHVRAALLGPSLTVPFEGGSLRLGTWQQIVLCEFDTQPRQREIVVQIIGESG
jgi:secondary thiamine-phosphate synthase enzyme